MFLGSLTFSSALFTLEAFLWLTMGSRPVLLNHLPFIELVGQIDPLHYFIGALTVTFFFWGATAIVALHNPVEAFLSKVVEDGRKENEKEVELLEAKTSILEMMSDTLNENTSALTSLRDVTFNVRAEILNLSTLRVEVENLKNMLTHLNRSIKKLEQKMSEQKVCPTCGKKVSETFRICPFCGENLLKPTCEVITLQPVISMEKSK
jgi:rRNA maturation endonuclease Nob1